MHVEPAAATEWLTRAAIAARTASAALADAERRVRDRGLREAAGALRDTRDIIVAANGRDIDAFDSSDGTAAFRDRLALTPARIEAIAAGLETIADLPDPLDRELAAWTRPNGLRIQKIAMPIGVLGMIYESRPNVGVDAAGLSLKSGNAVILRGGSESFHSAGALHAAMTLGLRAAGLPEASVQVVPSPDRAYVAAMLAGAGLIDLLIPRGGASLVRRVQAEARVPVLAHAEGLCHTYIHEAADPTMAVAVLRNAKLRRPGVCGATETLLIDASVAGTLLPVLVADLGERGCRFRADARARTILPELQAATERDFSTEWLDTELSVAVVDGVDAALAHIRRYGSEHTEAIITQDAEAAARFLRGSSASVTLWNASTQFCDGGEFGFGAEIGIATGRVHARGPVGLEQLTTFRYVVTGSGQVRP